MLGLMMDRQLTVKSLIDYAAKFHGDTEIVSRTVEGPIHRYTYADVHARMHRLANVLKNLGVGDGDRVATLAWNGYRHFELYFAVSGIGAVCHTINPRLFTDQIAYILGHAEDKVVFCDLTFVPVLEALGDALKNASAVVIMTDKDHMPQTSLDGLLCYEELMEEATEDFDWPEIDERQASSLCYSSGTTGNPKGVLYSNRSTVLHAYGTCSADVFALSAQDCIMPVVPMFHVNAWGIPYAAAMSGAKVVFPGAGMDGASLWELMDAEKVTTSAGVPTVWLMLMQYVQAEGKALPYLNRTFVGGSALPQSMIESFENDYDVACLHAWGMTEMGPLGSVAHLKEHMNGLPGGEKMGFKVKQGRPPYNVDMKIIGDDGQALPHDGVTFGELCVRGPSVTSGYFNDDDMSADMFDVEGWLRTGDVSTIDEQGYMQIVDRSKDVIKSGGEWISSIDLENIAVGHPAIAEAAVIGVASDKWDERPLLVCVLADGQSVEPAELLKIYDGKVAKWWVPDAVEFVDDLPHTATGKLQKMTLRERFKDYRVA